jgi:hypothetical protein
VSGSGRESECRDSAGTGAEAATATVRTPVAEPERIAAALRPDNTAEMTTRVAGGAVVTTIERDAAAGLGSTLDDYVVNLRVATTVAQQADRFNVADADADTDIDTDTETDTNHE